MLLLKEERRSLFMKINYYLRGLSKSRLTCIFAYINKYQIVRLSLSANAHHIFDIQLKLNNIKSL